MNRRRLLLAPIAAGAAVLWVAHPASASDLYSNIGPGGSISGLTDRYPLANYALDQHFDAVKASLTGGVDASGIPAMIAFFLANLLWQITAFAANALIAVFSFAFSVDLVSGAGRAGGHGALGPISRAIAGLYAHTLGRPWLIIGVTLAGCWAMWHALVQRRYTDTARTLAVSLLFCLLALTVVTRPQQTIGSATRWDNEISAAFLSITNTGDPASPTRARRGAADELFSTLILRPWVALDFGGTEHCIQTGSGNQDHDPISVAVRPLAANVEARLADGQPANTAGKSCVSNTARYAPHFLAFPPGSSDRDAEYQAINTADPAKLPDADPAQHTGRYVPAVIDKPAGDAMEKSGQYQRLLLALIVLTGELGALLLLGSLAVSVVMAQIIVLLLACFSPVALIAATIPGPGHQLFRTWAAHLVTYLVRKAVYALILAILLAVVAALQDATSPLGWLVSFGLQAALMWMVSLSRHRLASQLTAMAGGAQPGREAQLRRLLGVAYTARAIAPARRRTPPTPPAGQDPTPPADADDPAEHLHTQPPLPGPAAPPPAHPASPADAEPAAHREHAHRHARQQRRANPAPPSGLDAEQPAARPDPRRPERAAADKRAVAPPARRPTAARHQETPGAASAPAPAAPPHATRAAPAERQPGRPLDGAPLAAAAEEVQSQPPLVDGEPDDTPLGEPDQPSGLSDELAADRQRFQPPPIDEAVEARPDTAPPARRRDDDSEPA